MFHSPFVAHPRSAGCAGCREGEAFTPPFSMAFQPIVDVETMRPFAFEALVRGANGEGAATVLDQVDDLNLYAFDQACRVKAITQATAAGLVENGARLSINFLPNAVYSPVACIQLTLRTARANHLPLERLIFEFTENERMVDAAHIGTIIESYKQIGFTVAIDDFGAGHAGLGLFARFAPDIIKIDMELIRGIEQDRRRAAIVRATVAMCAELGTTVIAEGIETADEAHAISACGIRYHQGFFYARPGFETLPAV